MDLQEPPKKRGFAGGLSQHPTRIGIPKEGPTFCFSKEAGSKFERGGCQKRFYGP